MADHPTLTFEGGEVNRMGGSWKGAVVVLACGLVLGAGGAAWGVNRTSTTTLAPVQQMTLTSAYGPEAFQENGPMDGVGGGGSIDRLPVTVPGDASAYDALVTVTFRYRTTGKGRYTLGLIASTDVRRNELTRRPATPWPLAASAVTTSSTVQFVVPALEAAQTYYFAPTASTSPLTPSHSSRIATNNIVMTIQLTPRPD